LGRRLRELRELRGLPQNRLAFEGCTSAYVSRIEAGERVPSYQIIREFAQRLGVSPDYLATGNDSGEFGETSLMNADLAARTGNIEESRRLYDEALEAPSSPAVEAAARAGLGQIAYRAGEHERAIGLLQQAIDSIELPYRDRLAAADSLGRCLVLTSRYDEAFALFERFLAEAKERNDAAETIRFSVLLANTLIDRASFGRAEEVLAGILEDARAAVDPVSRAGIHWSQSRLHFSQNQPELAAEYARKAYETLEVTEHTLYTAKAVVLMAQVENERGHAREALELVEQALPAIAASGNAYEHGMLLLEKARSLAGLAERDEALAVTLGAAGMFKGAAPMSAGRAYALAASLCLELGDDARAVELYELAVEVLPVHDRHRVDALSALAKILEAQGKKDEALELLKQAVQAQAPVAELERNS